MRIRITVLGDDRAYDYRYMPTPGFSCLIEVDDYRLLFDLDSSWSYIKYNADALGVDLSKVNAVAISHWHADHYGGLREYLEWLESLGIELPRVYVPSKRLGIANEVEVSKGLSIGPHILSTGAIRGFLGIEEQAVVIDTPYGPLIVTGCCHPGLEKVIDVALEITGKNRIYGVIGGLHIGYDEALDVVPLLRSYGARLVAPCHCTGDDAIELFEKELGDAFVRTYVGKVITINL